MRRQAVAALLFVWAPLNVAAELASGLPSIGMRGLPAVFELSAHVLVAVVSVAAAWALWIDRPGAVGVAVVAIAACAATGVVQTVLWTRLPTNTMPGDKLPLAALIVAVAAGCVLLLRNPPVR